MPFLGKWPERFGEESEFVNQNAQFPGAGTKWLSREAHDIAHIEFFYQAVGLGPQDIPTQIGLKVAGTVTQFDEGGLADQPHGHDSACHAHGLF